MEFQASAAGVSEHGDCCPDGQSADSSVNQLSGPDGSDFEKAFVWFFFLKRGSRLWSSAIRLNGMRHLSIQMITQILCASKAAWGSWLHELYQNMNEPELLRFLKL